MTGGQKQKLAYLSEPDDLGVDLCRVPGVRVLYLPCIQQDGLGCVAGLLLGCRVLQQTGYEVPEWISGQHSLYVYTVLGKQKTWPAGMLTGHFQCFISVAEPKLFTSSLHPSH